MKRIVGFVLLIAMLLCGCGARPKSNDQATFSHWNSDSMALNALIEYVRAVTDKASPDYIPPADRIATFDMDGTLIGELFPTYLEDVMLMRRIFDDPTYTSDEDMVAFGLVIRDHAVDRTFPAGFEYAFSSHLAKAFAGMTLKEYDDYVTQFLAVTIYLPHVRGSQPQARDISLPKLYNVKAMVWRVSPRASRSYGSQSAGLPIVQRSICAG